MILKEQFLKKVDNINKREFVLILFLGLPTIQLRHPPFPSSYQDSERVPSDDQQHSIPLCGRGGSTLPETEVGPVLRGCDLHHFPRVLFRVRPGPFGGQNYQPNSRVQEHI